MIEETETVIRGGGYTDDEGNWIEWREEVTQPKGTFLRKMHETMVFLSKLPPPTHMLIPREIAEMFEQYVNADEHTPNTIGSTDDEETQ